MKNAGITVTFAVEINSAQKNEKLLLLQGWIFFPLAKTKKHLFQQNLLLLH